jgi:hypothetical protein
MATLESGFNPTYSENASILTGNPNRVTVEVEDTIDKAFWSDLLGELCPEKEFHFDPYHTILNEDGSSVLTGKGKSQIMNASADFNAWHIGCVDSDYDWILSDHTEAGKAISGSKYLLQTYAYSIENLMCLSSTLGDFCSENTEETSEFDFVDYFTRLSKAIYPLLVWSTYLYSKGNHVFTPTAWREVMVNTEKDAEVSLATIEAKARTKIEEFDKNYAGEIADKKNFELSCICQKDITEDDAYLYVRGHDLFDQILNSLLVPIMINLRNQHRESIKNSDLGQEACKVALCEYQKNVKPVKELLSKNYRYKKNTFIYNKIRDDVDLIWD